ncbi:very short patch repair endonuclease [Polymorphum gilvum]|uniref:Very short patch repair endonuclease n=1 Tax=Polymorphum gilvum (strain LMG 25793 / CGMCC 1.9160 / SL003B-26A1) TaxID=991905 RepID=F2J3J1_POLGS|nr:DNA mismatch endonuclease Vsr [Polymorphum gilvum]ADZ72761.1 DNA mismatch endonuclease Vsr [Polymorphum gilvum SL003B-26A1]
MVDFLSPSERSERMSRIRSSNTAPEVALRRAMHALGFRFRLHSKGLPGKPDIVLPRYKTVIFVHGCFWHRHRGCKVATTPKTNTEFWVEKFDRNVARDARTREQLERLGWRVIVVWECELRSANQVAGAVRRVADEICPERFVGAPAGN